MLLITAGLYSIIVAISTHIYLSFFLPIILLCCLKFRFLNNIFKKLFLLNIFILLSVFSVLCSKNYELAMLIFLRSNLILLFCLLIFSNISDITYIFSSLKFSDKIVSLIYLTLYFMKLLQNDLLNFNERLKARGLRHRSNLFTYKAYAYSLAMFFIGAHIHIQNLKTTLTARGFCGKIIQRQKFSFDTKEALLFVVVCFSLIFRFKELI